MSITDCSIIEIPKITDSRGNLSFIENKSQVPFAIERVYYLYDIPGGAERGGHAHRQLHQLIIAISGSFDIVLRDGINTKKFNLNRPYLGLYICPMIWREINNFSSGSVCLALASRPYEEEDYYRKYNDFWAALNCDRK